MSSFVKIKFKAILMLQNYAMYCKRTIRLMIQKSKNNLNEIKERANFSVRTNRKVVVDPLNNFNLLPGGHSLLLGSHAAQKPSSDLQILYFILFLLQPFRPLLFN